MIGQEVLVEKINEITADTMPRSLILIGDVGSGRHTLFNLICEKIEFPWLDLTEKITKDIIDDIYLKTEPVIYLIDIDSISVKEENMILKLVEEPLKNAYIIFIAKAKTTIIPTILNRCQIWELKPYSRDELIQITGASDDVLNVCSTPGQIFSLGDGGYLIKDIQNMCDKIIDHIANARFSNTLTIGNKIAFNNEIDKWNYDVFIRVLQFTVKDRFIKNDDPRLIYAYRVINQLHRDSQISHVNKQQLFENCLYTLRRVFRQDGN